MSAGTTERGRPFSRSEMMIAAAARELAGQRVCFVGVGLPNIAVNLAKRTVAPDLELVYESGVFGARPARLPLSASATPRSSPARPPSPACSSCSAYYLQRGLIDVGFLGAAQIDRFGNINTTVIGDYAHPDDAAARLGRGVRDRHQRPARVRDHAPESKRCFVERIDFRTSPGNLGGAEDAERIRREQGWLGRGPSVVVTDLGIYHFDDETGEMRLDSLHPGATLEQVREAMAWEPKVADTTWRRPRPRRAEELQAHPRRARPAGHLHEVDERQRLGARLGHSRAFSRLLAPLGTAWRISAHLAASRHGLAHFGTAAAFRHGLAHLGPPPARSSPRPPQGTWRRARRISRARP